MTDVTGFGLLGHLIELCEASRVCAQISMDRLPLLPHVRHYQKLDCIPGGTGRNFHSYGHKVSTITLEQQHILCDPQTSGGLLVAIEPDADSEFLKLCSEFDIQPESFGELQPWHDGPMVTVSH